jgi:hypothetical protein
MNWRRDLDQTGPLESIVLPVAAQNGRPTAPVGPPRLFSKFGYLLVLWPISLLPNAGIKIRSILGMVGVCSWFVGWCIRWWWWFDSWLRCARGRMKFSWLNLRLSTLL